MFAILFGQKSYIPDSYKGSMRSNKLLSREPYLEKTGNSEADCGNAQNTSEPSQHLREVSDSLGSNILTALWHGAVTAAIVMFGAWGWVNRR
jgi:hypothetical protein